jgi:NitT/TauT family transport system substrate-binding protein
MIKNLTFLGAVALAACLAASPGLAQTKLTLGSVGSAVAGLFAAKEEGFFLKRGLDASIIMVKLDPDMPAALFAHSLDIAVMSTPTFFQAVDGGLDLVVLLGGTATSKRPTEEAVVAANGLAIAAAPDFVGRKVGVPGIGAGLQVLFRYWLIQRGVDFHQVNFVEAPMPRMRDMLSGKILDAAVAVDPFITQMTSTGVGYIAVPLSGDNPPGKPIVMYTTTREWANSHPKEVASFREAIMEGAAFAATNVDKTRADVNIYAKLPPQIMQTIAPSEQSPAIDADKLAWWFGVMKQQGMLTRDFDVSTLISP